ncbi:MAG: hypothetical protein LBL46_00895 [Rickettsiales bacterium]|jgi:hypothetical protein|nr:hypothetical protein [Rickettsiales bacterium]
MITKEVVYNFSRGLGAAGSLGLAASFVADLLTDMNTDRALTASLLTYSAANAVSAATHTETIITADADGLLHFKPDLAERMDYGMMSAASGLIGASRLAPHGGGAQLALMAVGGPLALASLVLPRGAKAALAEKIGAAARAIRNAFSNNNNMMLR